MHKKNILGISIDYPINKENLVVLLNCFYPGFPLGDIDELINSIKHTRLSLYELEILASKLLFSPKKGIILPDKNNPDLTLPYLTDFPFVSIIVNVLRSNTTQSVLLWYSLEIFYRVGWNGMYINKREFDIIRLIRDLTQIPDEEDINDFVLEDDTENDDLNENDFLNCGQCSSINPFSNDTLP